MTRERAILAIITLCLIPFTARLKAEQTSSIVLSPDEKWVGAVNQDAGSVSLWDWAGDGRVRTVDVGQEPRTLAFAPDGHFLYVADQTSQTLVVVDVERVKTVGKIPIGGQPYGVLISPDGRWAYVSQYAGGYVDGTYYEGLVAVVDLEKREPVARIPVKARPWAMASDSIGNSLYVTHYRTIANQGIVTEIDPKRRRVAREFSLQEDDRVRDGEGGVFNALSSIALHPNGQRALVAGMHANVRRGAALNGQPLSHKTMVQAAVRVLALLKGQELFDARIVSSFSGQAVAVPSAIAFIGSTDYYIDVYFASNDFKVIQYNEQGVVMERAMRSLPAGPTGIAITRDGRTAFFNSRWARGISRFSLADARNPTLVKTVRACEEPWDEKRLQGALLFHDTRDTRMTANRWTSCAVCHLEGGLVSDGLVWDLTVPGAKPKIGNTMDLINTPASSPPFFHRGTPHVVESLDRFVQVFQQGSGYLAPVSAHSASAGDWEQSQRKTTPAAKSPQWQAIFAFIDAMRPRPNPHMEGNRPRPEIDAAAKRGQSLFFDPAVGCSHCHRGPALTVSGLRGQISVFDVGTGKMIDTPSLQDLWDTAPYLHDGRAATLREVLTKYNQQDRHGKTSHLTSAQINDLVTFLLVPCSKERQ